MSTPTEMAERHGRILSELAELGLSLARSLHERAVAAEDEEVAAELTLAFQRTSRSVRQTLALEAKLERDRLKDASLLREENARRLEDAALVKAYPVEKRKAALRAKIAPLIWREAEGSDAQDSLVDFMEADLDALLDEAALSDAFLTDSIESQVAQLRAELELEHSAPLPSTTSAGGPTTAEIPVRDLGPEAPDGSESSA